jgi:hypothetical protein
MCFKIDRSLTSVTAACREDLEKMLEGEGAAAGQAAKNFAVLPKSGTGVSAVGRWDRQDGRDAVPLFQHGWSG